MILFAFWCFYLSCSVGEGRRCKKHETGAVLRLSRLALHTVVYTCVSSLSCASKVLSEACCELLLLPCLARDILSCGFK